MKNMSETIDRLLNLHEKGIIDDGALNKALNALKEPPHHLLRNLQH